MPITNVDSSADQPIRVEGDRGGPQKGEGAGHAEDDARHKEIEHEQHDAQNHYQKNVYHGGAVGGRTAACSQARPAATSTNPVECGAAFPTAGVGAAARASPRRGPAQPGIEAKMKDHGWARINPDFSGVKNEAAAAEPLSHQTMRRPDRKGLSQGEREGPFRFSSGLPLCSLRNLRFNSDRFIPHLF